MVKDTNEVDLFLNFGFCGITRYNLSRSEIVATDPRSCCITHFPPNGINNLARLCNTL